MATKRSLIARTHVHWLASLSIAVALSGASVEADAAIHELTVYGINNFSQCNAENHSAHTDSAGAFRAVFDELAADGLWGTTAGVNNSAVRATYWSDASRTAPCSGCTGQDTASYGVDSPDVVYIHTHGSHTADYSSIVMGSATYGCTVRTDTNMLLGNGDMEVAIVKACQSGDRDTWLNGGYDAMISYNGVFSTWNAFHGSSSCGSFVADYVSDYAEDAVYDGLGELWLEYAYDDNGHDNNDDCPTSLVFGAVNKEAQYRYGGFLDRKSTGTKSAAAMWWISGCNPYKGYLLP